MPFKISEQFDVQAPSDRVWLYLIDPARVVVCIPGAELLETKDDGTFLGAVKVKVGPIAMSFKGLVKFTELDESSHTARMVADARESGGAGSAKITMTSNIKALAGGGSSVSVEAEVDLVGKIVQFGRGMIEEVSKQQFRQFSACVKQRLESADGPTAVETVETKPISATKVGLQALWAIIARFFGRLFGR
ncbi:MAG TPA: SRPBCC family protein [Blastocatellia bacterium]|nr:SRPBCC family protein [Blastocatellia bacterium]